MSAPRAGSGRRPLGVRRRILPGRLPSPGHDHLAGHLGYVAGAGDHGRHYLSTKPFDAPPSAELPYALRTFAHIVEILDLDRRAQVLDAGCGPGWLTEFLARCGYCVVGVDVSPDMIAIARARVDALPTDAGFGTPPLAELIAMPVAEIPWRGRFDAVIVNDSLHHFDDENRTLRVLRKSLVPGGRLFIQEAAWPRRRRDTRVYLEEMDRAGTLESPFRPGYLRRSLRRAGFTEVRRLAAIDRTFRARSVVPALRHTLRRTLLPKDNMFIAESPAPDPAPPDFAGALEVVSARAGGDGRVHLRLRIANRGRRYWPLGEGDPFPVGAVTVAPHLESPSGERVELPRVAIPRALAGGEELHHDATVRLPEGAPDELLLSLVREGFEWFTAPGSPTARVDLRG